MTNFLINLFVKDKENTVNSTIRIRYAMLSNITGIVANTILCTIKLIVGMISGSIAIMADGMNNLSDVGSNVVTILGFHLTSQRADKKHPLGHGRLEYITALIVDVMIITVGIELFKTAIDKIRNPSLPDVSTLTLALVGVAILVKLWMYFFYRKIGNKINSSAIKATSIDSLSDVVATSLVFISTLTTKFFSFQLDGWVGILVAGFILFTGLKALKETIELLLGAAPDSELVEKIEAFVTEQPEIIGIHDLMVHDYGPSRLVVTLHVEMDEKCSLNYAHDVIDRIERELGKQFECIVTIHPDPVATNDETVNKMRSFAAECVAEIDPTFTIHDFRMIDNNGMIKIFFDLCIPTKTKMNNEDAAVMVAEHIKRKNPACKAVIQAENPFV